MSILIALVLGTVVLVYWRLVLALLVIALLALLLLGLTVVLDDFHALQERAAIEPPTLGKRSGPG